MRRSAPWLWLHCCNAKCLHRVPMAITPLIIRWGGDASSDRLQASARCRKCGKWGADLQHPGARVGTLRSPTMRAMRIGCLFASERYGSGRKARSGALSCPGPRPAAVPATTTATFLRGPGESTVRVETIIERGPMIGKKSDKTARVGRANELLPLRPRLRFTRGAKGRLHPARRLGWCGLTAPSLGAGFLWSHVEKEHTPQTGKGTGGRLSQAVSFEPLTFAHHLLVASFASARVANCS
jgi:hypothetical protein